MLDYNTYFVAGLGKSGISAVRFLQNRGKRVVVGDTQGKKIDGAICQDSLCVPSDCECVVISPGIDPSLLSVPSGVPVLSDIALFCAAKPAHAKLVGITGSNGKSTVTTLVGKILSCGYKVGVGGNLGVPALDLLADDIDVYVLELSSFQLECVPNLHADVVAILNLTPDHLDRHGDMTHYGNAKACILRDAGVAVLAEDSQFLSQVQTDTKIIKIGDSDGYHLHDNALKFATHTLLTAQDLRIQGAHQLQNALFAIAICQAIGIDLAQMVHTLRQFGGLDHRCQWVRTVEGVAYFNDSKGTNVGASLANIDGLGQSFGKRLYVILGGVGKGQDFSPLLPSLVRYAKGVIVFGQSAMQMQQDFAVLQPVHAQSLEEAVQIAHAQAHDGDAVLLSPACASFDMFANFEVRGEAFVRAVQAL